MMIANLRVSSKTQKKLARDIGADVYPRVQHLVSAVAEDVGGILLEMQRGKVAVLDAPVTDETGQAEMVM
jgi:4-diphosphocytidyl-2C-methyl-D-erythritol kinase